MSDAPPNPAADPAAKPKPKGAGHEVFELAKTIVYALLIALVLRVILFQPFTIPSASMEPTLQEGDYIIVSKFAYGWSRHSFPFSPPIFHGRIFPHQPHRGDIVVFKLPRDGHTDYIKRLIGLPGDRIQVKRGQLYINDKAMPRMPMTPVQLESAFGIPHDVARYRETLPDVGKSYTTFSFGDDGDVDNTGVYTVPQGMYFMMGDNRDNSVDSRYPTETGVGFVPFENLVGRAEIILFSWKEGASLFKPWTWVTDARIDRFGRRLQ
jgi:signal peptidase I